MGVTRAKERVYLTNCWKRNLYGSQRYNPPSRFLTEIPPHLLCEDDLVDRDMEEFATAKNDGRFAPGDKVRHSKWGIGVIVSVEGSGDDVELKVAFPDQGIKVLLARYAPLEKVN